MKRVFQCGALHSAMLLSTTCAVAQSAPELAVEIGLTPEALVMCGVSDQSGERALDRIDAASTEREALANAHAVCDQVCASRELILGIIEVEEVHCDRQARGWSARLTRE